MNKSIKLLALADLFLLILLLTCIGATIFRSSPSSGVSDLGLMPSNSPNDGDFLSVSNGLTIWKTLVINTNYVRTWSGTSGNLTIPIASTNYFSPNNTFSNLITSDTSGATRVPITRTTTLQNLYVVANPAPGSGKTNIITIMTNGIASSLVASITGTLTNGSDTTHTVLIPAGTEIGLKVITAAS